MKFNFNIVQIVRNAYANRAEPEAVYTSARILWYAVLGLSACIIIASLIVGAWMLNQAFVTTAIPTDTKTPTVASGPSIDTTMLQKALDSFTTRKDAFDALQSVPVSVQDPS